MNGLSCTFFGHRDCSESIIPELYRAVEDLIVSKKCTVFYVGNHGNFDRFVSKVLDDLKQIYKIKCCVILAYMPTDKNMSYRHETVLPDGIEAKPKKYAITYRNRWMVEKSDVVITYVKNNFGGAAQFKEYAIKKKKTVIELYK
ncbi:MAG: hypothetical protein J6S13_01145 [Clostridia bacterium]|nr:hypothetical protein [Clostridia bacterium]